MPSAESDAPVCECFVTPDHMWLSAASCGYGGGYEPGSQMEWNPDCPAHPPTPAADYDAGARPWTLSELDAAHAAVGLGAEWVASARRHEIEQAVTIPGEVVSSTCVLPPTGTDA